MERKTFGQEKIVFYFQDKQLYRVDLDTLNRLWPIIDETPFKPHGEKSSYLSLPELHQLELALILIRRTYIHLSIDENSERLSIILEVDGKSMRTEPASFKPS